jgi:hypothetical protein
MDFVLGIHFHMSEPVNVCVSAFTQLFSAVVSVRHPKDAKRRSVFRINSQFDVNSQIAVIASTTMLNCDKYFTGECRDCATSKRIWYLLFKCGGRVSFDRQLY